MGNLLTTDAELTTVANAIRSKGGTSAQLGFPTGMKNAIDALNVGTGLNPAAAAGDIRAGKKAVVNRTTITGTATERTSSDLTQSGPTVTAPAGYYASAASKSVGTARSSSDMTVSDNVVTAPAGYYAAASSKAVGTVKAAATYHTSSSDQSIAAGNYLAGAQTIKAVTTSNIDAGNIKKGVVVKVGDANDAGRIRNVTGTYYSPGVVTTIKFYPTTQISLSNHEWTGTLKSESAYSGMINKVYGIAGYSGSDYLTFVPFDYGSPAAWGIKSISSISMSNGYILISLTLVNYLSTSLTLNTSHYANIPITYG